MPHTLTKTIFKFAELSDRAKERARDWWRSCEDQDHDTSMIFEDVETCASILGIDLRTRPVKLMGGGTRYEPCIHYSGFSSRGDGASFEGFYNYTKGASKKIREHAPQDKELHRIADELQNAQRPNFYRIEARMSQGSDSNFYSHSGTMIVDVTDTQGENARIAGTRDAITQLMRDFADWIYDQLRQEYEWRMSDEQVNESIAANEYDFNENGHIS